MEPGHFVGQGTGVLALRCWGRFELSDPLTHADLSPRGRKARAILAYLALHADRSISRQRLMGLLWGDRAEPQARSSLRQAIYELRELCVLGLIAASRDSLQLHRAHLHTDIDQITAALAAGQAATLPDPDEQLFEDLDGLGEGFDDWLRVERTRQRDVLENAQATAPRPVARRSAPRPQPVQTVPDSPRQLGQFSRPLAVGGLVAAAALLAAPMLRPPAAPSPQDALLDVVNAQLMSRQTEMLESAEALSRRAIRLAPKDARAWTALAEALAIDTPDGPRLREAEHAARRAIALDPKAGLPHGVLGMILGFTSAEARGEIETAARLSPRDPQVLFWLSNVQGVEGAYQRQLETLRAAVAAAPSWGQALTQAATMAMRLGYRQEADTYVARLRKVDRGTCYRLVFEGSRDRADYAAIVRQANFLRAQGHSDIGSDRALGFALLAVGDITRAQLLLTLPDAQWRLVNGEPGAAANLAQLNRDATRDELAESLLQTGITVAINAGRAREVVAIYDAHRGSLANLDNPADFAALADNGINVAIALRAVGRRAEAQALLDRLDRDLRRRRDIGPLPLALLAATAQLSAARGDIGAALTQLETAAAGGWHYAVDRVAPDIADIPAFSGLRGESRFERLRAQFSAERGVQRAEIARLMA